MNVSTVATCVLCGGRANYFPRWTNFPASAHAFFRAKIRRAHTSGKGFSIGTAVVEKRLLLYDYQNVKFATRYTDTLFLLFVMLCAIIFQSPDKWYNKIEGGGKGSGLIMNLVRVILISYLFFLMIFSYGGQGIKLVRNSADSWHYRKVHCF